MTGRCIAKPSRVGQRAVIARLRLLLGADLLVEAVAWGEPWDYEDDETELEETAVTPPR